jgi:hypothetical protein
MGYNVSTLDSYFCTAIGVTLIAIYNHLIKSVLQLIDSATYHNMNNIYSINSIELFVPRRL